MATEHVPHTGEGSVVALWRYPVKSMRGEQLESARLGEFGVPGDRLAYVADWRGATVSARTKSRLLQLTGGLARDGSPTVDGHAWDSEPAAQLVREAAGTELAARELRHELAMRETLCERLLAELERGVAAATVGGRVV